MEMELRHTSHRLTFFFLIDQKYQSLSYLFHCSISTTPQATFDLQVIADIRISFSRYGGLGKEKVMEMLSCDTTNCYPF